MFNVEPQDLIDEDATNRLKARRRPVTLDGAASHDSAGEKVLPSHVRTHNRTLVLRTLYRHGRRSRADLARSTDLTKVSVSRVVSELLADNLIREVGVRTDARRGKPAMLLEFNNHAHQIITLDLSHSTVFRGALSNLSGEILARRDEPIENRTGQDALNLVLSLAEFLKTQVTTSLLGVGVGTPGIVDRSGRVLSAPNRDWCDLPLADTLSELLGAPANVMNDANIAVRAERSSGQGTADMMLIKVGTSVGAGLLLGDVPVMGARFAAGEIGHFIADVTSRRRCVCGAQGCLDTWLSTPRLAKDLANATTPVERMHVLTVAGQALGSVLAPVVATFNLSEIVLSGPPLVLEGTLMNAAMDTIRRRLQIGDHGDPVMRLSVLSDDIIMRGAVAIVLSEQLGIS